METNHTTSLHVSGKISECRTYYHPSLYEYACSAGLYVGDDQRYVDNVCVVPEWRESGSVIRVDSAPFVNVHSSPIKGISRAVRNVFPESADFQFRLADPWVLVAYLKHHPEHHILTLAALVHPGDKDDCYQWIMTAHRARVSLWRLHNTFRFPTFCNFLGYSPCIN